MSLWLNMMQTTHPSTRPSFDLLLQGCHVRLNIMTNVITDLVELFDAAGAFIFGEATSVAYMF
jgi:hypothetical protein